MKIGHFSDLHGELTDFLAGTGVPDIWICTGDFFPNITRGDRVIEHISQKRWLDTKINRLINRLGGAPIVEIGGNHDYISLGDALRKKGYPAYTVTPKGVTVKGLKFSGFREIPYIIGEWNGETHDFSSLIEETMNSNPDVLVTHAPPSGILDGYPNGAHYGISQLTNALTYAYHNIRAHFFGHMHEYAGQQEEIGILFCNSAQRLTFVEV